MSNQYPTAASVLANVEGLIANIDKKYKKRYSCDEVYEELSIFDSWVDYIGLARLKDMRKFLREAIKLGYTGYVCFKVGATGCANGMWAHTEVSTDGFSPNCKTLYKSFTPEYNYWSFSEDGCTFFPDREHYDELKTIKQLEQAIIEQGVQA